MALRGERYELIRPIASGGMATVHLARVRGMGGFERLVALKLMHPHLVEDPDLIAMFLDEARIAARIRHPNVVSTIDVGTDQEGPFLVMEYIDGPSLAKVLRTMHQRKQRIPVEIVVKICLDMLAGLEAAHELRDAEGALLNVVHRDISPQNVLIGKDGGARITDFGVARAEARLSQATKTGQIKGKVAYLSPEQTQSKQVDRRSDVYAAGIVFWEALTNQRLVQESNELLAMMKIKESRYASPREFDALIPQALSDACMKALRPKAEERYPSAAAFAEAIETAAAADGIPIATARAVGAFIAECQETDASSGVASSPSGRSGNAPPPPSGSLAAVAVTSPASAPSLPTENTRTKEPILKTEVMVPQPTAAAAPHASAPMSPLQSPAPRPHLAPQANAAETKGRTRALVVAGVVVGIAAAAAFALLGGGASRKDAEGPAVTREEPSAIAPQAQASAPPPSPVAASPSPPDAGATEHAPAPKPASKSRDTRPSKVGPVYRPPEL